MNLNKTLYCIIFMTFIFITGCSKNNINSNAVSQIKSNSDITLFITSDTHYIAKNLHDNGEAFSKYVESGDGKQLKYIDEIINAFIFDIKKKKPNILILSGDLTNNGEKESHLELAKKLNIIEESGTSVFVIPGNHDILNPWARKFKGNYQYKTNYITPNDFSEIYKDFGYSEAISRDKNSLSYLAAPSKDLWLLMIDSAQYKNNEALNFPQADGAISPKTLQWIKDCSSLAKENHAKIITVMHHNLLSHIDILKDGYTLNNNTDVLQVFKEGNFNLNFSGHMHIQDIKSYEIDNGEIYDIASSALSVYPHQYGILNYSPKSGFNYTTSKINMKAWTKKENIKDKTLINFQEFSKQEFEEHAYKMSYRHLKDMPNYTETERDLMAQTMAKLHMKLAEGTENVGIEEILNPPGFKLWETASPSFLQRYVMSIAHNIKLDNNKLKISNINN